MNFFMKHLDSATPFLIRLQKIFSDIDEQYRQKADYYGFNCRGCDDNCCRTLFFHHTYIEFFYLMEGVDNLPPDIRKSLYEKAKAAKRKIAEMNQKEEPYRLMCPLNTSGLCILYDRRPMICRMHGIPHELRPPGKQTIFGPGCGAFSTRCGEKKYFPFDRTPFYIEMSNLEKELKQKLNISRKFKKTITHMLVEINEISGC
jgi:Fe-S-cluster containining protein